jgi:hypothetical protein
MFGLAACASESAATSTTLQSEAEGLSATAQARNIWDQPSLQPLQPGTYYHDPDLDPSTTLRVVYEIPYQGWSQWIGAFKPSEAGHVGISITTVNNLVTDACLDHTHANPSVGPSVDDLANALASLAPFVVTSPAQDVSIYGYDGRHLELTVPDLAIEGTGNDVRFTECASGELRSWVAPFDTPPDDAYYGYTGPGYTEEFWIIDIDGTRLMIAATRSAGSPESDLAEQRAILDSITIEP